MREKLAILGGEPLRKEPFPKPFFIDDKELNLIIKTVKKNSFSPYVGAARSDIETILKLKSRDTFNYGLTYWNPLGGENVRQFEKDFAEYHSVDYAVAVNSATSGLSIALGSLNIEVGSEVLVPAISFSATALSCLPFNCVPVFVDVDPKTYCISPDDLERKITSSTAAVIVVHLLGNAVDMDKIFKIAEKYNLPVIEDCAQSIGVKYKGRLTGTMGVAGVFSFQETKNIMTGEGGMIITNNPDFAKKCRLIRNHGENAAAPDWTEEDLVNIIGFNFRMTELTAALGIEQLKKVDFLNKVRKDNVNYLIEKLKEFDGLIPPYVQDEVYYIPHMLAYQYDSHLTGINRKVFLKALKEEGIICSTGYAKPLYQLVMFQKKIAYGTKGCPFTCPLNNRKKDNENFDYSNTDKLFERFLFFYGFNYPAAFKDMDDIYLAVKKIYNNLDDLRHIKPEDLTLELGR